MDNTNSRQIITYLLSGTFDGPMYSVLAGTNCKLFVIPRERREAYVERKELSQPALYVLMGPLTINTRRKAYIGETSNFKERVQKHYLAKDFWTTAWVFISSDNSLNKAYVQYLEYIAIKQAIQSGQFDLLENYQLPNEPAVNEWDLPIIMQFFENAKLLMSLHGVHLFDDVQVVHNVMSNDGSKNIMKRVADTMRNDITIDDSQNCECEEDPDDCVFYIYGKTQGQFYASALLTNDECLILEPGSYTTLFEIPEIGKDAWNQLYEKYDKKNPPGWCIKKSGVLQICKYVMFDTPDDAGKFISGDSVIWCNKRKQTIKEYLQ